MDRNQLDPQRLSRLQAYLHRLPHALAGYLQWLTPQIDGKSRRVLQLLLAALEPAPAPEKEPGGPG